MAYKNIEDARAYGEQYRRLHKQEKREYNRRYNAEHPDKRRAVAKKANLAIRVRVLEHYGDGRATCIRCGFSDIRALSIDHIAGGGAEHRRAVGTGGTFYRWLIKNNYPKGFQTLCMNCQLIKRAENGENTGRLAFRPNRPTTPTSKGVAP